MKIAIIGGGFTGLTAAHELLKKDHDVTIFERGTDLGGLASGFQINGTSLEKAYHHLFRTDTSILSLVEELGLDSKLEWRDSSVATYYNGFFYPFGGALDLLKFVPLSFASRVRLGVVILYLQKTKNWKKFVKVSAYDWMLKYAGEEVVNVIWKPLLGGKFDKYYKTVSMAWLWARLHVRANSRKFGEGEKLGYFNGGFQVVVEELTKRITEMGANIQLQSNVQSVKSEEGNCIVTILEENGESKGYSFDKVICTVPSHVFAKLIENNSSVPKDYLTQLNSIDYLGAVCLIFSSSQDLSKFYWHNINDLSAPFLAFINHTKLIPKERYGGENVYYLGAYLPHDHGYFNMENDVIIKIWFDYLKKMIPNFDQHKVISKFLFKFKNAQHIVDMNYESKIPEIETPLKNVYLSNFSQIFPEDRGTNYAVREGKKIADLIN